MTMYAADYKKIASVLAKLPDEATRREMGLRFAWELRNTNPRFSLRLFRKAIHNRVNTLSGW